MAKRLAAAGMSVAMVESELVGGECPYWACMPAKTLLRPPEAVASANRVPGVAARIDSWDEVLAFRDGITAGGDDARKTAQYARPGRHDPARARAPGRPRRGGGRRRGPPHRPAS